MRKRDEIASAFASRERLDGCRRFFLVGIGGAGMSALARMLRHRGYTVLGTDGASSGETDRLLAEGFDVSIGHSGSGLEPGDAVVLTDAIDMERSPEVARARELGLPLFRRSQALGWLLRSYRVLAVTGTHGKTTTTGMLGSALAAAGEDPLVVVGAAISEWGGPVREGKGPWAVVEACEAYDSFHDLDPSVVVLTNLELDHVDFHGSWENLRDSVARFVGKLPEDGALIYCEADPGATEIARVAGRRAVGYSASTFSGPELRLPGEHNVLNAGAVEAAASVLGLSAEQARKGAAGFGGAERRLQVLREGEITVIDDYAHHPTEIAASLQAVRDRYGRDGRRVVVVYQPHLYSRTAPLIAEFGEALSAADVVVLTDIYPAREDPIPGVSSARIAERVRGEVRYVPNRHLLPRKVASWVRPGDVVVGMGAGTIVEFGPLFLAELDRMKGPSKVAVLYGGDSAEREVSLLSGRAVCQALLAKGYDAFLLDVSESLLRTGSVAQLVGPDRPDVCFLAVHGTNAEDGAVQGFLQLLHLPYTGSGILASAIAMDKARAKEALQAAGVRVPRGFLVTAASEGPTEPGAYVVKPNSQGSTVGVAFVEDVADLRVAIERALAYDKQVLVEEWVRGVEISVPVVGDEALPAVEIVPSTGTYDFEAKYTPGATEERVPARLPGETEAEARKLAVLAHQTLGCQGATRTDMIVKPDGEIVVLEINTLPGMTGTSLLPRSAAAMGVSFEDLVSKLVISAWERHASES